MSFITEPKIIICGNTNPSGRGINGNIFDTQGLSPTLTTNKGEGPKIVTYTRDEKGRVISRRLVDLANTIHTSTGCGGSTDSFVAEPEELSDDEIKRLNDVCGEVLRDKPKLMQIGNIVCEKGFSNPQRGRVYDIDDLSPNIDTFQGGGREPKIVQNYRIRKLTPRECFRLMGVSEKDIDNIQKSGISKTQQYKMAGNSIVVDVLYHIFRKMFINKKDENQQLSLF